MTASYRVIDYSLRSAKFAERKMLAEALARLRVFGSLRTYRYVGFGSIWYADCVLFHRALGIEEIVSIERERDHEERFVLNKPYRAIELRMDDSAVVLPRLEWGHRTIVWLDYDDPLSPAILDDVRTVATRACPGTALIVSVQAEKILDKRESKDDPVHVTRRDQFRRYFGDARTPRKLPGADLRGWRLSKSTRRTVRDEVEDGLQRANEVRGRGQRMKFRQFVAFEYADNAKMTTIGGVFIDAGQDAVFDSAGFGDLSFYRAGDDALRIEVPLLTPREMRELDRSLPCPEGEAIEPGPIPPRDAKHYAALYRYLPNFAAYEP